MTTLIFGFLPVAALNRTLDLELEVGEVVMVEPAQRHAERRHPEDFARCLPHVASVVTRPLYVRDDLKNPGKIELVGRIEELGTGLLVAVTVEPDAHNRYHVTSFYPVSEKKIETRRLKQTLKIVRHQ